ncbi:PTS fructose transporter subunit IIABC [Lacrimispora sp.]|uniref:PTS fructose transporter subunit IIABC n=1 Tax=Lacrimispora sp. TaxID=2719234 RepID=UPI0028B186DD|nr:fructose-specific PTS transporter subunit EIIC [Lacrimispora sp.]
MLISTLIKKEHIVLSTQPKNRNELFVLLSNKMSELGFIRPEDKNLFKESLEGRESLMSTAVGDGVAIPHSKNSLTSEPAVLYVQMPEAIAYGPENEAVDTVFMISVPEKSGDEHLRILAELSRWLMEEKFRTRLREAKTQKEVLKVLEKQEQEKKEILRENAVRKGYIIGVTACPTGIAHTYMSAENLRKTAESMGYHVKIETNGSVGVENELTSEDIRLADAVVIAADTKVNTERFAGKKLFKTSVSKGIKEPQKVIECALAAPKYEIRETEGNVSDKASVKGVGVYGALMNGVSNMLPLVVAGGILIAISFFWGINSASPEDPSYNAIAAIFNQIGGAAFSLFVPIMAGYIAFAIADRPGLAPGLVGGYLAANGGSGFLGAILSGFLAGYIVNLLKRLLKGMPKSMDGLKPVLIYPLLSVLIVGIATAAILNPVMGTVNNVITSFLNGIGTANRVILGFIIGAMLAADLGGPINKAAYFFSVGALVTGNYEIMAAAMCSGMVPSLATALAATISKKKFSVAQQEAAKANYILGLSFIAEGAIPFAASDPFVILPSLMVGAGIAGSLSMILGVTCPAPHGGIFVLPVIGNPLGFLASLIIGTLISTLLILCFKKERLTE